MQAKRFHQIRRGVLVVEVAAALALLALLVVAAGSVVVRYQQGREYAGWRHAAIWAAEAQLRRYKAGAAIDSQPPPGMIAERIALHTQVEPGSGDWESFHRITVTATVDRGGKKPVRASVSGYVRGEASP